MVDNIYEFGKVIKEKVISNSMKLICDASNSYGINFDFEFSDFVRLSDNLYNVYEYKQEVYKYEQDMDVFLTFTIINSVETGKENVKIEDILDTIYEVKTTDEKKLAEKKNKVLAKYNNLLEG